MTTKKKTQTPKQARRLDIENLAELIAAVIAHPALPSTLRQTIREGISEAFNDLAHYHTQDRITDSPAYITLLLIEHARSAKGGKR
jgi:hypothetical protein